MRALLTLTLANIRSYRRDRASLFWTLAFPLVFIVMFGLIFQGGGASRLTIGWVDLDKSSASALLHDAFASQDGVTLAEGSQEDEIAQMKLGKVDAVIVVPTGYGDTLGGTALAGTGAPAAIDVYTDPSRPSLVGEVYQAVGTCSESSTWVAARLWSSRIRRRCRRRI